MSFKDHFSQQAHEYAKYRPRYPAALFEYLAALASARETAWDCATGNGQAALGLAPYFKRVLATDASAQQIGQAVAHERVEYRVAVAEHTDINSRSVDLITVAQALHWFRFEEFYAEVNRVLKPGGVIAVWSYDLLRCDSEIDPILDEFYYRLVGPFWPPERKLVEERYKTIPFPYPEINPPEFFMETEWRLEELIGYLRTWSATQRFVAQQNFDPLPDLRRRLETIWDEPSRRKHIKWPLHLRVGKL